MKKVIIIGASSGIGEELALLYARKGCCVGITGRRQERLLSIQKAFPQTIHTACFDVTGTENQFFLQDLIQRLGGLDLLIYNAGFGEPSEDLQVAMELSVTQTNAVGFVEMAALAYTYFVAQGYGQIAVTSSVAALRGNSRTPAYSASKAFVSRYAEGLAIKAGRMKKDIVVTDIRPGFVATKPTRETFRFWEATPQKAARQILQAIEQKKRVAYVTHRWWLVAQVMKIIPFSLYRRLA